MTDVEQTNRLKCLRLRDFTNSKNARAEKRAFYSHLQSKSLKKFFFQRKQLQKLQGLLKC